MWPALGLWGNGAARNGVDDRVVGVTSARTSWRLYVATHQDAVKRTKQNEKRRQKNRHYRTMMRNQIKKLRALVEAGDHAAANAELSKAVGVIQRVSAKGIIHPNQAARRCSRLNAAVRALA